ncbi:DUF4365 domain-containing protein [Candidatus Woesearchaeota archaeon]|nr:DUF4365 domain-containing protein [Candidatus Woesearchaeota archaeon]
MITDNDIKEGLSKAYVKAVCNMAGYIIAADENDYGFDLTVRDVTVRARAGGGQRFVPSGHNLDVQLKATADFRKEAGQIVYRLDNKNYNDLVDTSAGTPRILVVLCMPDNRTEWINQDVNSLIIKECAFWVYLGGREPAENEDSKTTIQIPEANVFSVENLTRIMNLIKSGGALNAL